MNRLHKKNLYAETVYADLDMDIDNYSLEDVLALFKLKYIVSEEDLKQVKKTVMQTHPE